MSDCDLIAYDFSACHRSTTALTCWSLSFASPSYNFETHFVGTWISGIVSGTPNKWDPFMVSLCKLFPYHSQSRIPKKTVGLVSETYHFQGSHWGSLESPLTLRGKSWSHGDWLRPQTRRASSKASGNRRSLGGHGPQSFGLKISLVSFTEVFEKTTRKENDKQHMENLHVQGNPKSCSTETHVIWTNIIYIHNIVT